LSTEAVLQLNSRTTYIITRKRDKAQRVACLACANAIVHLPTDWLCYCHLANDL